MRLLLCFIGAISIAIANPVQNTPLELPNIPNSFFDQDISAFGSSPDSSPDSSIDVSYNNVKFPGEVYAEPENLVPSTTVKSEPLADTDYDDTEDPYGNKVAFIWPNHPPSDAESIYHDFHCTESTGLCCQGTIIGVQTDSVSCGLSS